MQTLFSINHFLTEYSRTLPSLKILLDGSLPANPVNDRRVVYNAVTLKSTFCQP